MATLGELLKKVRSYKSLAPARARVRRLKSVVDWHRQGCPVPPPTEIKHAIIKEYAKRFRLDILIETGTFFGDTIAGTREYFTDIYSIELSPELYNNAKKRFAGDKHVHLLLGNSPEVLGQILPTLTCSPLFWLDAHYSGGCTARGATDTPILQELETICTSCPNAVVLIDDARHFDGTNSYPTLVELRKYIAQRAPHWVVEVKDDIIRLHRDQSRGSCNRSLKSTGSGAPKTYLSLVSLGLRHLSLAGCTMAKSSML